MDGIEDWKRTAVRRVREAILANTLRDDGTEVRLSVEEAERLAETVVCRFLAASPQDYPLIRDHAGLKFVLEERSYYPGFDHDILHVLVWNDDRWVTVEEIPFPPSCWRGTS